MKEIIEELLRVEDEAKKVVPDSAEAARQSLAEARAAGQRLAEEKRLAAAEQAHQLYTQLVDQARAGKQARLEEARVSNRAAAAVPEAPARRAVELICRAVTETGNDPLR